MVNYAQSLGLGKFDPVGKMQDYQANEQNLKFNDQTMQIRGLNHQQNQDERQAGQEQAQQMQQVRQKAAELAKNGQTEELSQLMYQFPDMRKEWIDAAKFQNDEALNTRVTYAKDILSGSGDPAQLLNQRIQQVEQAGGDASGLRSIEQTPEVIKKVAEMDLMMLDDTAYKSYQSMIGGGSDYAPQVSTPLTDPDTGQIYVTVTDRNTKEAKRVDIEGGKGITPDKKIQDTIKQELLKQSAEISKGAFDQLSAVKKGMTTIDEAIAAIDRGAESGVISNFFPSITESTVSLENAANKMGLDVVAATTFGALSEGELKLAMNTAVPRNMKPAPLREWLVKKKQAQNKLAGELRKMAIALGKGKTTPAEYLEKVGYKEIEISDSVSKYYGG